MTKKELRTKYKTLRDELTPRAIEDKSLLIANQLLKLPVWEKTYFHIFLPIVEHHEIDTQFIMHVLSGKDKEMVVSKSDFGTMKMTHFLLTENTKFIKNSYNIPEPVDGIEVPVNKIEVVFVPLLAFDSKGHRVGYGKGFYDSFLSECKSETIKIGLSLFDAEEAIDNVYESDVKLNYCVTPDAIYTFGA
jgi:5-formyltetrahydrofolate cyclo-ligase